MLPRHPIVTLAALAGAVLAAAGALAQDEPLLEGTVRIAQLIVGDGSEPRPNALRRLAWELDKRTSIDVATSPARLRLEDAPALFRHPLLYLAGDRAFSPPSDGDVATLRRHLAYGGTLMVDSAEARPGGGFDASVRALVARLFTRERLAPVRPEHVVMKSFYLLPDAPGRIIIAPALEAVEQGGRLVVIYSQNDLGGAWARDGFGRWEHDVTPGGSAQRERAFRVGINLVMYALCLDYKDDQVHVPFILKRRQWRVAE
ncbi:MAG: DUF4159 domain-containing protein [Myxococcota bacterium]